MVTEIVVSAKYTVSELIKFAQVFCISPYSPRPPTETGTGSESLSSQD